jgi:hypothetical protein
MPLIKTEEVANIRKQLKDKFPNWKFSVTRDGHSRVSIVILSGPLHFEFKDGRNHQQVNEYYIEENHTGEWKEFLLEIYKIAKSQNYNPSIVEDSDYGHVPSYYISMSIGDWDKPYVQLAIETMPKKNVDVTIATEVPEGLELVDYSEKAIALFGNSKAIKDVLKELGGRFNPHLTNPKTNEKQAGWIFSKKVKDKLESVLAV